MTPADRFFDQPPEITVLGPLGSFRVFGTLGNDFATATNTTRGADNLSWVHGRHRTRAGAFFLSQSNWRDDLGAARGQAGLPDLQRFPAGAERGRQPEPVGRSNIQTIQANEGVGPKGEVQYDYRSYYGAAFVQDDFKVTSRLTLNLGLRWEYVGPALDAARHHRQRLAVAAAPDAPIPPAVRARWSATRWPRTTIRS